MPTSSAQSGDLTHWLQAWSDGDAASLELLVPAVYAELHRIAQRCISGEDPGRTLQTTALAHEAFIRLMGSQPVSWQNRAHFFAVAARQMRRILIDVARAKHQARRGCSPRRLSLEQAPQLADARSREVLALEDALKDLEKFDARKAQIVEMRYFAGLSVEEIAAVLKVSDRTVFREWETARVWLYRYLRRGKTGVHESHASGSLEED